ncbi:MAG: M15 family metallopeptidase [Bauldia litoralis]
MRTMILMVIAIATALVSARAEDRPADFVNIVDVIPDVIVEARYAGYFNFVGQPIDGYEAPACLLTRPAAEALARVQAALKPYGFGLKVFDCYRPERAVAAFVRWAEDVDDIRMKPEFYPELDKGALFDKGYIAAKSGHSRGSTVDLTVVTLPAGVEVYMGTGYDFFSERSWPDDPQQPSGARGNRLMLTSLMQLHGFKPYPYEWWHFTLADEPYPDTYFDFPVK